MTRRFDLDALPFTAAQRGRKETPTEDSERRLSREDHKWTDDADYWADREKDAT